MIGRVVSWSPTTGRGHVEPDANYSSGSALHFNQATLPGYSSTFEAHNLPCTYNACGDHAENVVVTT